MPCVDLCAAGLHKPQRALLSQGQDHAAAAQALLHFGCRALAAHDPKKWAPVFGKDHAPKKGTQCTGVKKRDNRRPDGQSRIGRLLTARSHEPTIASTRPTRSSTGSNPTPPARTGTRLSAELSRLSPITKRWPGGTTTSVMLSNSPRAVILKIGCS